MQPDEYEFPRKAPSETVWKFLVTGQAPHHQTHYSRVDERFAARTQLLVVLTHPPVVVYPGEGSFHEPASRQRLETPSRKQPVEADAATFLVPLPRPGEQHLLWPRLRAAVDDLDAQA